MVVSIAWYIMFFSRSPWYEWNDAKWTILCKTLFLHLASGVLRTLDLRRPLCCLCASDTSCCRDLVFGKCYIAKCMQCAIIFVHKVLQLVLTAFIHSSHSHQRNRVRRWQKSWKDKSPMQEQYVLWNLKSRQLTVMWRKWMTHNITVGKNCPPNLSPFLRLTRTCNVFFVTWRMLIWRPLCAYIESVEETLGANEC